MLHGGNSRNKAHVDRSLFPLSAPPPAPRGCGSTGRDGVGWCVMRSMLPPAYGFMLRV